MSGEPPEKHRPVTFEAFEVVEAAGQVAARHLEAQQQLVVLALPSNEKKFSTSHNSRPHGSPVRSALSRISRRSALRPFHGLGPPAGQRPEVVTLAPV